MIDSLDRSKSKKGQAIELSLPETGIRHRRSGKRRTDLGEGDPALRYREEAQRI